MKTITETNAEIYKRIDHQCEVIMDKLEGRPSMRYRWPMTQKFYDRLVIANPGRIVIACVVSEKDFLAWTAECDINSCPELVRGLPD